MEELKNKKKLIEDTRYLYFTFSEAEKHQKIEDWKKYYFEKIKPNNLFSFQLNDNSVKISPKKIKELHPNETNEVETTFGKYITEISESNQKLEYELNSLKRKIEKYHTLFYYNILPLKNWNLSHYKSFRLPIVSDDLQNSCKVMTYNHSLNVLVIGTRSGEICLFNTKKERFINLTKVHNGCIKGIAYLLDGKSVVTGGKDGMLIKHDLVNDTRLELQLSPNKKISNVIHSSKGDKLIVVLENKIICVDPIEFTEIKEKLLTFQDRITSAAFYDNNDILAVGFENGKIVLIKLELQKGICEMTDQTQKIRDLAIVEINGSLNLLSVSKDNSIIIYDMKGNVFRKYDSPINDISFANYCYDEHSVLTTFKNGKFGLFNFLDGKFKDYEPIQNSIHSVFYLGDGRTYALGTKNSLELFSLK